MGFRLRSFTPIVAAVHALLATPVGISAQDWVERGVCTAIDFHAVAFSDSRNAYAVGQGYVVHSGDGGSSWAPLIAVNRPLHDVSFRGASLGLAVGDGGSIIRTTDGGQSWSEVENNLAIDLRTVTLGDGGMAIAAGFGGALRSLDNGLTWGLVDAGDLYYLGSAASGPDHAWLVGEGGSVRATTDGGSSWRSQPSGTTQDLRAAFFISPTQGWIAGAGGSLLYTEDGGATWVSRGPSLGISLNSVHFVSPSTGWVVGSGGAILRTEDAGLSWIAESSLNTDELLDVSFSPAGQGCVVGIVCTVLLRSELVTAAIDGAPPSGLVLRPLSNPVRALATIRMGLPTDTSVRMRVLDVQGRIVAKLAEARFPAGWHEVQWNAGGLAPGLYLIQLQAGGETTSTRVALGR